MSKARDLADYVSAGGVLTDGVISVSEINDLTATAAELNTLDGITATVTELNFMDGVTSAVQTQMDTKSPIANPTFTGTATAPTINASTSLQIGGVAITSTAAELNILDGVTATTAELNFVDGVTSNIQTQLDAKGTVSSLSDLSVTSTAAELNTLDGFTGAVADLNRTDVTTEGLSEASKVVTADSNGVVSFDNGTIEESTAITSSAGAATINLRDGNIFTHTLTENVTYTFSNPAASGRASAFILKVTQDSSGRTITWPSSVDWAAATAPTLTATNAGVDVFGFMTVDGGTTYYGFTLGQAMG